MEAATQKAQRALQNLGASFVRNNRLAVETSALEVQAQARAKHKFRTISGNAEKAVDMHINNTDAGAEGIVEVSPTVSNAPYAIYLHEGTKAHWVAPRAKRALRWVGPSGQFLFSKGHTVGGITSDPFLYNALDAKEARITEIFQQYFDKTVREAGLD